MDAFCPPQWLLDPLAQDPYHDTPPADATSAPQPQPRRVDMTRPLSPLPDHLPPADPDHSYHTPPPFLPRPAAPGAKAPPPDPPSPSPGASAPDSDSDSDRCLDEYERDAELDADDDASAVGLNRDDEHAADLADRDEQPADKDAHSTSPRARRRADKRLDDESDPAVLRARLRAAERRLRHWRAAASALVNAAALSPDLTTGLYARTLRAALSGAVADLSGVRSVRHVHASMPAVACEAPAVDLLRWHGLARSTWAVDWAPCSWWVSLAADATRWRLPVVSARVRVSALRVRGAVRTAFSPDLSAVRVAFARPPRVDMAVDTSVEWGVVPVPVQESIDALVREHVAEFVARRLSGDGMVLVLRRREAARVSDSDVLEATHMARSAGSLQLSPSTFT